MLKRPLCPLVTTNRAAASSEAAAMGSGSGLPSPRSFRQLFSSFSSLSSKPWPPNHCHHHQNHHYHRRHQKQQQQQNNWQRQSPINLHCRHYHHGNHSNSHFFSHPRSQLLFMTNRRSPCLLGVVSSATGKHPSKLCFPSCVYFSNSPNNNNNHDDMNITNAATATTINNDNNNLATRQTTLLTEASYLTKTLYRKCLYSIKLLANGNERDEFDFLERERSSSSDLLDSFDSSSSGGSSNSSGNNGTTTTATTMRISMAPPVNRRNELASRANYYKSFARENFDGHFGLLMRHGFYLGEEEEREGVMGGYGISSSRGDYGSSNHGDCQEHYPNLATQGQYPGGHHHLGHQLHPSATTASSAIVSKATSSCVTDDDDDDDEKKQQQQGPQQKQQRHYMWREEQIEQFIYLIQSGEEKRKWILEDYGFDDPFNNNAHNADYGTANNAGGYENEDGGDDGGEGWSNELERRLQSFETEAYSLVKDMYHERGWVHSSDYLNDAEREFLDDEDFGDDDDGEGERKL